jgi:hypothetical protein
MVAEDFLWQPYFFASLLFSVKSRTGFILIFKIA